MSYSSDYFAYRASVVLEREDPPFYALVMAAMRKADSTNLPRLIAAFPDVWADLYARYHAPLGLLETDPPLLRERLLAEAAG